MVDVLDTQLHRGDRGILTESLRVILVQRRPDENVRAFGLLGMGLRQEYGARTEVVTADLWRRDRFGPLHIRVADDREVVTEGLE